MLRRKTNGVTKNSYSQKFEVTQLLSGSNCTPHLLLQKKAVSLKILSHTRSISFSDTNFDLLLCLSIFINIKIGCWSHDEAEVLLVTLKNGSIDQRYDGL